HACDAATRQPLGALDFRLSVIGLRPAALIRKTGKGRPGFVHPHKLLAYYRRGAAEWYMVWGNAVYGYEANPLVRWALRLHPAAGHAMAWLCGVQPRIRLYVTEQNRRTVDALAQLGRETQRFIWCAAALALLVPGVLLYAASTS